MLNKTFCLLLLSLIPIFGFSQANSQYPDSGNKIRLGFQTSGDGLIWRDTQPKAGGYRPINNKAAWIILDTMNNKFYHYKNSTWTLAGGQDIDTANLIATKYNLGFKLSLADTGNMLTPYWRSGRFSGVLPVLNGGTNRTTMPAGYILHGDGTSVDTAIGLFWDRSNKFLGVGTTSPVLDITINSSSTTPGMAFAQGFTNTSAQRGGFYWLNNNNSTVASVIAQAQGDNVGTGLEFSTRPVGGANTLNMVLRENGNVGIGTASPQAKLEIAQDIDNTDGPTLRIANNANTLSNGQLIGAIDFYNGDDSGTGNAVGAFIRSYTANAVLPVSSQYLSFASGGTTERMRLDASGNLMVGTTSAAGKLHVYGSNPFARISNSVTGDGGIKISYGNSDTHGLHLTYNPGSALSYIDNTYPVSSFQIYGDIYFRQNVGGTMTTRMAIKADGGNVGIGTTSPTARLQVKGSGISTGEAFKIENSIGTNLLTVLDNGSMTLNTPLSVANGGTGQTTTTAALNALLPTQSQSTTIGATLKSNGTNSYWDNFSAAGTVQDQSGNFYNTVAIGTQIWFKENLRTKKYRSGALIPVKTNTDTSTLVGQMYYYNNDSLTNYSVYGALYNWKATQNSDSLCPVGWHVPTDAEWTTLTNYLIGESVAGGKMKSTGTTYWNSPNTGATNEIGFSVLPGGYRNPDGSFANIRNIAFFWSATEYDGGYAWFRALSNLDGVVFRSNNGKSFGASVRCLKN